MTSRRLGALGALFVTLALAFASAVSADEGVKLRVERIDTLSYPTVRIVASVLDAAGRPVRGLNAGDLVVTEDGIPVPARVDLASDTTPVALAFVLDASGSMAGGPLQEAISAGNALTARLGPKDQAALITFREDVQVAQDITSDKSAVIAAARRIVPDRTPLASYRAFNDALTAASDQLLKATPGSRGAIVLVTDGFDSSSTSDQKASAIARARGSVFPVYTVAVGGQLDRPTFLNIAEASGGQSYFAPTAAQLAGAYSALSEQILTQYVVAYFSTILGHPGDGRQLSLKVMRNGTAIATAEVAYAVPVASGLVPATPKATAAPTAAPTAEPTEAPADRTRINTSLNAGAAIAILPPGLRDDPAVTIAVLGAAAAFSLFLFIANGVFGRNTKVKTRLLAFVPRAGDAAADETPQPFRTRVLKRTFTAIGSRLGQFAPEALVRSSARSLEQAGHPLGLGPQEFLGLRVASMLALAFVSFLIGIALVGDIAAAAILLGAGLLMGFVLPGVLLGRAVKKRQKQILKVLPSTVDMIALSVEAGLSFDGAIAQVGMRRQNALSDEFKRLLLEFQMGRPRKDALRELARRCGVAEVGRLTNVVLQADQLGAPLSKALGELSVELRTRRRQHAEEVARTAPIKMMFPMVGLIFPALFVVIIGPAVPRIMALFTSAVR